ncbi:MAG TPA: AAA family ATPase [Candidatus Dormibacteraeota bacterium]
MAIATRALSPVLAGREAELSTLEDALLAARRGAGGVVILGGEAGMGKTRLASELSRRAERLGCVVMSGGCTEAEVSLPYLPFLEAIGNHLSRSDIASLRAALGPAAQELGQLFPQLGVSPAAGGDPVHSKLRLFEAILLLLLTQAAGDRGLLLVLEDLHWADPATRELLDYLTRRLRATNVLTLATYRTDEMHRKHALLPTIQGWRRAGSVELIELDPLPARSISEMLRAIFDETEVSDELVAFLGQRTEGNPFVIEEMLKEAIDRGDIFRTDTGWDRKAIGELRVPPTVRDGILLRLERLPGEDAQVLAAASVIGRSFAVELIAATAQISSDAALESLQRCVLHQLLEEEAGAEGRYRFRHALTREAIYEDMVTPRRQQLHSRVADALAAQGRPAAELAHHLLLARRDAEAVEFCRQAAAEAFASLAYADAAALLERAAPLVGDGAERGRLLYQAADARWLNTESGAARRLAEASVAALEAAGELVAAARSWLLLGRCHWELNRSDLAQAEFEKARTTLEPLGPSEDLAIVYVRLAGIPMFNHDYAKSLEFSERAESIAQAAGAERALSWAWTFGGGSLIHLGQVARGFEYLDRGFELARDRGFWFQAGNACFNSVWSAVHIGLGRMARKWHARAAQLPAGVVDLWLAYVQCLPSLYEGRLLETAAEAEVHANRSALLGYTKQAWRYSVLRAHALAELDQGPEAAAALPPVSSRVDKQDIVYDGAARVRTALALGDIEGAVAEAKAIDTARSGQLSPLDAAAEVLYEHEPAAVAPLLAELTPSDEASQLPRARTVAAVRRLASGDLDGGRAELMEAIRLHRSEGFELEAWYASLALARAQIRAGQPVAAGELLISVIEAAEPAHARLVQRLAREVAAGAGIELPPAVDAASAPAEPEPIPTGERLVTVLFCDVRDYTETVVGSPPADLADRISAFQRWATSAVAAHHGVVDKFAGDAVMATFNVSGASIDHAEQAVRCAREILDKAAAGGLPVGAGVATGAAVVGRLTDGGNLSVLGLTTNLAARLQSASRGGEITVSEEAFRRLSSETQAGAERVTLELKGFPEPVTGYRLSGGLPLPPEGGGRASGAV